VEDADWMVRDFGVVDVSGDARRIQRNIGRRIDPAWVPKLMKSFEGPIKSRLAAASESHDGNSVGIYPGMPGQHHEAAI